MRAMVLSAAISAFAACAESPGHPYRPEVASSLAGSLPSERTRIPPEAPQGTIEVSSSGITQLHLASGEISALQVRLIVTNNGEATWQLDTREQYVEIPGEGRSRAMYVSSDVQTLPVAPIGHRERHVFELYFPLPRAMTGLSRFAVDWQVNTPRRAVALRTTFDRVREQPQVTYGGYPQGPYWAGIGPYWWYDPVRVRDHRPPVMVDHFHGHFAPGGAQVAGRGP